MTDAETRLSYTVVRTSDGLFYRGAIRRRRDDAVIWECDHEHRRYIWKAVTCAQSSGRAALAAVAKEEA